MTTATINTLLSFNDALPVELLERLSEPCALQRNGEAFLPNGLESIKENITNVHLRNGEVIIETNLFHDRNSTSSKIKTLNKGGGVGVFHLTMTCKY
jgi:hypothetical protein